MKVSDPIKISYRTLSASKLRFFLTVLGVVIGVASVILVMAIGASAQKLVLSQIENVGSNLVAVLPGASEEKGPPASALGVVTTSLTYDDLKALRERKNVPHLSAVAGYVTGTGTVEFQSTSFESSFQGVSPDLMQIENMHVASGRFFFPEEETDLSRVIVLGYKQSERLFANRNPIGEVVNLKNIPFKVIGVLEERGSAAFSNPDTLLYVPLATAQKLLVGINYLNFVRAKIDDPLNIDRSIVDMNLLLRKRHDIKDAEESDFSIRSTAAALDILTTITDVLKYFLLAIASISLLVGGVGIMNSMLISVSQRVREVGLRKAVGAQKVHIIIQFLIEASFITIVGGIIGILFGVLIAYVASIVLVKFGYDWQFIIPLSSLFIGFFVAFFIGIIFGLYPAIKASRISPMEALRYE